MTAWKLVPAVATEEMIRAGWIDKEDVSPEEIYCAMLDAAPAATGPQTATIKPLEWDLSGLEQGYPARAESIFGDYTAWEIDDGYWKAPDAQCGRRAQSGLQVAIAEAQADYERRVRSALASEPICALARVNELEAALRPFAREAQFWDHAPDDYNFGGCGLSITAGDIRRANEVLENRKIGLADATNDPADLSSLRKGAEVAALDVATRALNRIASRQESHPVSAAFAAMTEIRALVSGSREDGE